MPAAGTAEPKLKSPATGTAAGLLLAKPVEFVAAAVGEPNGLDDVVLDSDPNKPAK